MAPVLAQQHTAPWLKLASLVGMICRPMLTVSPPLSTLLSSCGVSALQLALDKLRKDEAFVGVAAEVLGVLAPASKK